MGGREDAAESFASPAKVSGLYLEGTGELGKMTAPMIRVGFLKNHFGLGNGR